MTDSVMVPREPTIEMMKAASVYCKEGKPKRALDIYRAMLAAAPAPAAGGGEDAHEMFEAFVAEAISNSPEPLRELGQFLTTVLDEDHWKTADRYLLALAALQSSPAPSGEPVLWQAFIVGGVAMPLVWLDKAKADEWLFEYGEMENLSLGIRPLYAAPVSAPAGDDELRRAKEALAKVRNTTHHSTGFPDLSARRAAFKVADEALADLGGA